MRRNFLKPILRPLALRYQKLVVPRPKTFCLVTGAPRSGTTAVGDWLVNHRSVTGLTESRLCIASFRLLEQVQRFKQLKMNEARLQELTRSLAYAYYADSCVLVNKSVLLDKEPLEPIAFPDENYEFFIEQMRKLWPNLKLIFMLRNPIATVWSMQDRTWGYSLAERTAKHFSIEQHIRTWTAIAELIEKQHSRPDVYVCRYERLIENPEAESRRICDFLEIAYADPFSAKKGKDHKFSEAQLVEIREATDPLWDRLTATA